MVNGSCLRLSPASLQESYLVCADFRAYLYCQDAVDIRYLDAEQ
jgi:hypothetical protein